jgi:transcriptional regulator
MIATTGPMKAAVGARIGTDAASRSSTSDPFTRYEPGDVRDLIAEYPLAWLCTADARADLATQLPLLGEYDGEGVLTHLLGHIPRRHPLVLAWQANARTRVLFQEHPGMTDEPRPCVFAGLTSARM